MLWKVYPKEWKFLKEKTNGRVNVPRSFQCIVTCRKKPRIVGNRSVNLPQLSDNSGKKNKSYAYRDVFPEILKLMKQGYFSKDFY